MSSGEKPLKSSTDATLSNIEHSLKEIDELLKLLLDKTITSKIKNQFSRIDHAKFFATLSFILCSLKHVQLKLQGINSKSHPISNELARIKAYVQQISDIQSKSKFKLTTIRSYLLLQLSTQE